MDNEKSSNLHYKAQTLMKKYLFFLTLLIFSLSFGQTKKGKTTKKSTPKTIVEKKIQLKEKNIKKSDPNEYTTIVEYDPTSIQKEEDTTIYNSAGIEVQPEFIGGNAKLYSFIGENFEYSEDMKENELRGKVIVSFVVEKDGSLSNLKVIRSIGYGTDNEAMRVVTKMPKWLPGEQNGKKVRCSYTIPIMIYATKQ